jgi:uncharacterized protein YbjQ (UPF0145 family)
LIAATGNINERYEVIGVVHAVITRAQKRGGCGRPAGLPIQEAYEAATKALVAAARESGGNGVIHIGYDYRLSSTGWGCNAKQPVIEVYAWGTAIELR